LGTIATPNGGVAFLQLVTATAADKTWIVASPTAEVIQALSRGTGMQVTDLSRA
jgi:hypothetical protein